MKTGISLRVCRMTECESLFDNNGCALINTECDTVGKPILYCQRCRLPDKCLYKNLHIINGLKEFCEECDGTTGIDMRRQNKCK